MYNKRRRFKAWYDDRADYNTNAKSYYDDLARKNKLIQLLAERIWEYEETLDLTLEEIQQRLTDYIEQNDELMSERLENWDKRIDEMPEEMESLFLTWLNDGTLEQIINHNILGNKADKSFVKEELEKVNTQLTEANKKLTRSFKYGEIKLPEMFPKKVPFNIYKTKDGYVHDFDFTPYEYTKKIYVSKHGTTHNDGLTPETPTRNIDYVLDILSNVEENNVSIVFLDSFFPNGHWVSELINFEKNIRLTSTHKEGTIFGNFAPNSFFKLEDGLFKMERNAVGHVLLYNVKDVWGNPSEALKVDTLVECKNTPNSYYTDDVNVWVNAPSETLETADDNIGVVYRINHGLRFNIGSNTLFIDNVKFAREGNKSRNYAGLTVTGSNNSMVIARDSYFNYGDRNGFESVNVGNVHLFNCQASHNLIDGFNYHGTGEELITEFNCYASDNGDDTQGSANATTGHDGMTILRIGTIGERCYGPVLADVNGCYSFNIGCAMYDSMNQDSYAFFFSDTGGEQPGTYYLIDCDADNPNGFDVVQNGGTPIKIRNTRFNTTTSNTEFEYI